MGSETTLIVDGDPEAQEQDDNLGNSTGDQGNSVVVAVDVHLQLATRLRDFRREGRHHGPGSAQYGTYHSHHNSLLITTVADTTSLLPTDTRDNDCTHIHLTPQQHPLHKPMLLVVHIGTKEHPGQMYKNML